MFSFVYVMAGIDVFILFLLFYVGRRLKLKNPIFGLGVGNLLFMCLFFISNNETKNCSNENLN